MIRKHLFHKNSFRTLLKYLNRNRSIIWYYLGNDLGMKSPMTNETKGSQLHLRTYVNDYSEALNQEIFSHSPSLLAFTPNGQQIEWKSPLAHEGYKEYQDDFFKFYCAEEDRLEKFNQSLREYWPKNGPVWDGIGTVEGISQIGLILVEAKAHRREELNGDSTKAIVDAARHIGGVVISAAIILGGTFAALIPSGVITLIEVAMIVIIGLLLLSFVMLPILIPALLGSVNRIRRMGQREK